MRHLPDPIKPATTYEEQLLKLKARGLVIVDEDFALEVLQRVNYYRFTGYLLPFRLVSHNYAPGTSFEAIHQIYDFDQNLRNLVIRLLDNIEISVRAKLSYYLAHKYEPMGYENWVNFEPRLDRHGESLHRSLLQRLNHEFARSVQKRQLFAVHHFRKYGSKLPIWVAVELMSFGDLSTMYFIMKDEDKLEVSETYFDTRPEYLDSWLKTLRYIRNTCAHFERLYDLTLGVPPKLHRRERKQFYNQKVFSAIYVCFRLLDSKTERDRFLNRLEALIDQYSSVVDLDLSGFPENWSNIFSSMVSRHR